jgi:cobalt-zinc-cadmium efflux system outer membrane protein
VPQPSINGGIGKVCNYDASNTPANPCNGCSNIPWTIGISDGGAIADSLSGKRGLRLDVAKKAFSAAKLQRVDAQRVLEFQVKQAYVVVAESRATVDFAKEVQASAVKSYELNLLRYPKVIDEGTLARVETAKLEADQGVDNALMNLRNSQISLAYLLGVRSTVPNFEVDEGLMKGSVVPPALAGQSEDGLVKLAFDHRPDLVATNLLKEHAESEIALARRLKFPDFVLSLQYSQTGTGQNAIQPPTLMFGVTIPIPLFYSYEGEIKKGEADLALQSIAQSKIQATIVSDVGTAYASYTTARKLVERMETKLLASAKKARDITEIQFNAGQAPLMDFLDAQRTYIATNVEYLQDLTGYWTAIYQLEQAVGMELRK